MRLEIFPAFSRSQSTISKRLNILYEAGTQDRQEVDAIALDQISELTKGREDLRGVNNMSLRRTLSNVKVGRSNNLFNIIYNMRCCD